MSLAASAVTAPLVAFHFQQVSLVGPLANLVAVPFTGFVVLPAGWLALAAAALWAPAGQCVAAAAIWSAERARGNRRVVCAARVGDSQHRASAAAADVLPGGSGLCAAAPSDAFVCGVVRRPGCVAAIAGGGWAVATHRRELLVAVLDVGQGLACAVMLPGGGSLLYDAGPRWRDYDAGERIVVPALRRLGVTRLETLAISHPHPDHDGGVGGGAPEMRVGSDMGR